MSYGENEVSTNQQMAKEPFCPHYEQDSEWQVEMWSGLKTTGFEVRVCRNCSGHIERRPQDALIDFMAKQRVGGCNQLLASDTLHLFDTMNVGIATIGSKRFEDTLSEAKDVLQEVKDGKSNSKDTSPA